MPCRTVIRTKSGKPWGWEAIKTISEHLNCHAQCRDVHLSDRVVVSLILTLEEIRERIPNLNDFTIFYI